jgi:hypothetical protein
MCHEVRASSAGPRATLIGAAALALACGQAAPVDALRGGAPTASPTAIYVEDSTGCPTEGTEAALRPEASEVLVVASLRLIGECSGAGGDWLIGRALDARRDLMFGSHTCYFLGGVETRPTTAFGVVRVNQTAARLEGPKGWCITDADGAEPVTSDVRVRAVAVFETEAAARAAAAAWATGD